MGMLREQRENAERLNTIERLVDEVVDMDETYRMVFIRMLSDEVCLYCGSDEGRYCYCMRDD